MYELVQFDRAIELTGYGKFNVQIFVLCALCMTTVGFQNGIAAYIFPAAQCELKLSSYQLGVLNISFLIGGVLSSFLWGLLADSKGRKPILILTHSFNISLTIICITNQTVISLIICRFCNGFFIGGPGSIIFTYLAEFQPLKYRSSVICYAGIFFPTAWLLLPFLAYLILPININFHFSFITITSWRLFVIILIIPEIVVTLWLCMLPETPEFFVAKNNAKKALTILRKMYAINNGKFEKDFPVKSLAENIEVHSDAFQCQGKMVQNLKITMSRFGSLFSKPFLKNTLLMVSVMFTNMFGIFGLGWWLPELFIRFQRFYTLYPNSTITIQEIAHFTQNNTDCKPSFDLSVIQSTAIMGMLSILTNIASGCLAHKVPLKVIPGVCMLIGGFSATTIYWLTAAWQNLLIASIFQSTMITANMTIGGIVVELFPTRVGALALGLTMCAGRIGAIASNFLFGIFMDKHCEVPILLVAGSVLFGAVLCFLVHRNQEENRDPEFEKNKIAIINCDSKL